jgi:hypothetical protein
VQEAVTPSGAKAHQVVLFALAGGAVVRVEEHIALAREEHEAILVEEARWREVVDERLVSAAAALVRCLTGSCVVQVVAEDDSHATTAIALADLENAGSVVS